LGLVAILPFLVSLLMPVLGLGSGQNSGLLVTSAGLLIVVGVVRDTFYVIEAELSVRGYDDAYLIR
jgi:preprotein translocase subunit SecY